MVNNVSQINNSIYPVNTTSQGDFVYPNIQPVGYDELKLSKKKKKSHKVLTWLGGIAGAIIILANAAIPTTRMRFCNLFKKQASEEVIMNSIRKYAKEIAHLDKEKKIFLNPKTGALVHSIQGEEGSVTTKGLCDNLFDTYAIGGHNHPDMVSGNIHLNDGTFSMQDLFSAIQLHSKYEFVVTQKSIYHIKYNNNYDEKKFLEYLINNKIIVLNDRKPETIKKVIKECKRIFNFDMSTTEHCERGHSQVKKICDHMGWTYWREPLAA